MIDTLFKPAKSGYEFDSSGKIGGHTAIRAVFLCPKNGKSFNGRAIWGAFGLAGCLFAGLSTRMVPPTLLTGGVSVERLKIGLPS